MVCLHKQWVAQKVANLLIYDSPPLVHILLKDNFLAGFVKLFMTYLICINIYIYLLILNYVQSLVSIGNIGLKKYTSTSLRQTCFLYADECRIIHTLFFLL